MGGENGLVLTVCACTIVPRNEASKTTEMEAASADMDLATSSIGEQQLLWLPTLIGVKLTEN